MNQTNAHCPTCQEQREVEVLLSQEQKVVSESISEGAFEELITNLIVQCKVCQGLMIFPNASPESITSQTPLWPPDPEWRKALPWSSQFDSLDREARLALTPGGKAKAIAQLVNLMFLDHSCRKEDFVSSFAILLEQKKLDPCFNSAQKILQFLEGILDTDPPNVSHNDMLDIENFYLALRSQLYETPALLRKFDEQWNGFSKEYFVGDSA